MLRAMAVVRFSLTVMIVAALVPRARAATVSAGAGSYTDTLPAGQVGPQATIYRSYSGPVATHRFWTAKNWYPTNTTSNGGAYSMFPRPLSMQSTPSGLRIGYYATVNNNGYWFNTPFQPDLTLGVAGLSASTVSISAVGDWSTELNFGPLSTRVGRGWPFVYASVSANPTVTFAVAPTIWSNSANVIGAQIAGNNYGLFCPSGGTWSGIGTATLTCNRPAGKNYVSLALLPSQMALADYAAYAFSFPTDTRVSWSYDENNSQVTTTYTVSTVAMEGTTTGFLQALYPHQYASLPDGVNTPYTYVSARGTMKVFRGSTFTTTDVFHGILPYLPPTGNYSSSTLQGYVSTVSGEASHFNRGDTYVEGKRLARIGHLLPLAKQVGDTTAFNNLLSSLEAEYQAWFVAPSGKTNQLFYYDSNWKTLIGYPGGYGSNDSLNDHHFHYGYWLHGLAMLGLYDPAFIASNSWGGMADLLARDIANPVRGDDMFPFLRHFDVYAGHSWASGQAPFGDGGNEESSSEAVNAWAALILYATEIGDGPLRDAAIWLYTMETTSVRYYWFNNGATSTFPAGFSHLSIANLFDAKSDTGTWFGANSAWKHGIEWLPYTGGSLYLGRDATYSQNLYNEMIADNGGALGDGDANWPDLMLMYRALFDPSGALAQWNTITYVFDGETRAHEYYWMTNLQKLGHVDYSVTADTPLYAVFLNPTTNARTHVAYNVGPSALAVAFSDGATLSVGARSMAWDGGATVTPTPIPATPTATATATATATIAATATATATVRPTATPAPRTTATPTAIGDFTQSVQPLDASSALLSFTPNGFTAGYVIVHYSWSGLAQQNVNMAWSATSKRWELTLTAIPASARVSYSFTYQKLGAQYDSVLFSWTNGGATATATATVTATATPRPTATATATATATVRPTASATATATPSPRPTASPTRDAYSTIQAESDNSQLGTQTQTTSDAGGGQNVGWIANGDWLEYNAVAFGATSPRTVLLRIASGAASGVSGTVELRLDSTGGPLIAQLTVASTGGWQAWTTASKSVSGATGTHNLFVVFKSGQAADFVNLNWFYFGH